jgi:SNF2 family DNA or RNA helicase
MVIINEDFSDDSEVLEKIEKKEFEPSKVIDLKFEVENITEDGKVNDIISYSKIKQNLEYDLPHQRDGALKILRDLNGTALLADEVGLGKTITAGLVLKECIDRELINNALILTPPSLVDQWAAELKSKFELNFKIIEKEEDWNDSSFLIASIDKVKIFNKTKKEFRHKRAHEHSWDLLIVDEAHKLKDRSTSRWEFVDKIPKKRFLILTATPFQNDLLELYNLLHLLKRGHLGTVLEFKKNFLNKGNKRHPLNPRELKIKLDEVMIRRRRDETQVKYMRRIPKIVAVELTSEEKEAYDSMCELLKTQYFSSNGSQMNGRLIIYALLPKITSSSKSAIETLHNIIQNEKYHSKTKFLAQRILDKYQNIKKDSKMEKLIEIVKSIYAEDKNAKILIYTRHPTTLKYMVEKLSPLNLKIVEFAGGLDRAEKTNRLKEFKDNADILISTDTGAEGLNFQFCNNLINYDLPWNPMAVEQRIGRLDRIGQKKDMNIFSLATKQTMEEKVVDLIINKMCCIGMVIGELPIILFSLGIDGKSRHGNPKIEEMLMNAFINSKNNLEKFERGVDKIALIIEKGIGEYAENKKENEEIIKEINNK